MRPQTSFRRAGYRIDSSSVIIRKRVYLVLLAVSYTHLDVYKRQVHLREYSKIERDIVIIGVSSRFEIWAAEVWEEYLSRMSAAYESIAEKLVSYGPSQQ